MLQFDSTNARYREKIDQAWQDLLTGPERPIEMLSYDGFVTSSGSGSRTRMHPAAAGVAGSDAEELDALMRCPALPKLRELEIRESGDVVSRAAVGRRR